MPFGPTRPIAVALTRRTRIQNKNHRPNVAFKPHPNFVPLLCSTTATTAAARRAMAAVHKVTGDYKCYIFITRCCVFVCLLVVFYFRCCCFRSRSIRVCRAVAVAMTTFSIARSIRALCLCAARNLFIVLKWAINIFAAQSDPSVPVVASTRSNIPDNRHRSICMIYDRLEPNSTIFKSGLTIETELNVG